MHDNVKLLQFLNARLHRSLVGDVGEKHEARTVANSFLFGGLDTHLISGEHSRDRVQHTWLVAHFQSEQKLT